MKNFYILILVFISIQFASNAIELERMVFDWEEIIVDRSYTSTKIILTYQDEIILGPKLRISYDRGENFKEFTYTVFDTVLFKYQIYKVDIKEIGGYAYDKDNGLYILGCDNLTNQEKKVKYSIYYIPPTKDTVFQKFEFEINDIDFWTFPDHEPRSFLLSGNKIILQSNQNVWLYNIQKNSLNKIQFVDSLQNLVKEGTLNSFEVRFVNFNTPEMKIDIYYGINDYWRYKYSIDDGLNWIDGNYNKNCNIELVYSSMYQWNGKFSWYSIISGDPFYRLDEFCQKYELTLDTTYSIGYGSYGLPMHSSGNYLVYADSYKYSKMYYSKNKGDKFYRIENLPFQEHQDSMKAGYYPSIFSDGEVMLNFQIKLDNKSEYKLFKGTPKNTAIYDNTSLSDFNIYPNPTSDFITLSLDRWAPPSDKVQIFDMLGIEVYTTQTGMSELLKIDVSHLPTGVYFIKFGDKVEKFVKM